MKKRIYYDEGDFDVVVGMDRVTIAGAVGGYAGIVCVNGPVIPSGAVPDCEREK